MPDDAASDTSARIGLRDIAQGMVWALRESARTSPLWLLLTVATSLVLALVPAAQVRAVALLVDAADGGISAAFVPLLLLTVLVAAGQVLGSAENLVGQRAGLRLMLALNARLARTAAAVEPQQLARPSTLALLEGARESTFALSGASRSTLSAGAALLGALALGAAIWPFSALAAVLVVLALLPNLMVFAWSAGVQDTRFTASASHSGRFRYLLDQLIDARTGTELSALGTGVKVAGAASEAYGRFTRINDRLYALLLRGDLLGGLVTAVLLGGALVAVLRAGAGAAGLGAGVLGVIAGLQATRGAGYALGDVITVAPLVRRFRELEALAGAVSGQDVVHDVAELRTTGITVQYPGASRPALSSADLHVRRGEMVALVGVNGAGKTSLVGALLGIVPVTAGTVAIDGVDAAGLSPQERLARFGLVTQEFGRYEMTVRDALALGTPEEEISEDALWHALAAARAEGMVRSLPQGLDTMLGTRFGGVGLSGGQWQRIALARINLRGAGIRVLDEPTSAIDAEAEQEVFAQLRETAAEHLTIVVSHRAWTLRGMDRIHVLEEGRIVESGTFEELMGSRSRFAEIFAEQL